ncbi:helix-turn-helix transcriptional regulator, partial [Streptomyces sp. NPDC005574]|uniref:helix-turn-helix transcriptional regulator n=1 Tax=Streptomyces sp. NPDC005574 TaxID=3156891 RepID=UPI0033AAF0EB
KVAEALPAEKPLRDRILIPVRPVELQRLTPSPARGRGPLLLVDDAHRLDSNTAELLKTLAQRRSVDLIVTVDADIQPPPAITDLWKDQYLLRLDVLPLGIEASRQLAAELLGGQLLHDSASRIADLAGGSPQLLHELIYAAHAKGMLVRHGRGWHLTEGIPYSPALNDLIRRRMCQLDSQERRAVELVALAEPVPLELLEELTSDSVLLRLEELSLIRTDSSEPSLSTLHASEASIVVRLDHPMTGHFIQHHLSLIRRRNLIEQWIDVYEAWPGRRPSDQLRLAEWRLQASLPTSSVQLVKAARFAHHTQDLRAGVRFAKAAWRTDPGNATAAAYGRALVALGEFETADQVLNSVGSGPELDEVRVRGLLLQGRFKEAESLATCVPGPRGALYTAMAGYLQGRFGETLKTCEGLLKHSDPALRIEAGLFAIVALCHAGRPEDALRLYKQLASDLAESRDPAGVFHADSLEEVHASALADAGRLAEAYDSLVRVYGTAVESGRVKIDARRGLALGMVLLERGRPRQALPYFTLTPAYDAGWEQWRQRARISNALATAVLPDRAAAAHAAAELPVDTASHFASYLAVARAWHASTLADQSEALRLLLASVESHLSRGAYGDVAILVHEMARLGLAEHAADYWEAPVQGPFMRARLDHCRAIATKDGKLLQRAAAGFAATGADLYAAEAFADLSRLHRSAGSERAASAARLQASTHYAHCEGAVSPALQQLEELRPLSAREREITLLAVRGLSDKEIAAHLVISIRTVSNHLYRIYRKVGVNDRAGLRKIHPWH